MLSRILIFLYGVVSYALFFLTFLYALGFVGNFGVPKTMDSPAEGPRGVALLIDAGLLALFALQHSIMARPAFKRWLTQVLPAVMERSTYVLASSLALLILFFAWQPLGGVIWKVETDAGRAVTLVGFAFGWTLVLVSTFVINHFDLFGLRQVWRHLLGQPQEKLHFVTPALYRIVRHPLYVGWFFAFWFTPVMTVTHLFFAVMTTGYILIAIRLEERDLSLEHPEYSAYRRQVPMLIPRFGRRVMTLGLMLYLATGAFGQSPIPANLQVPDGHALVLKTRASGTQNYVCLPGASGQPAWSFLGPQATVFVSLPYLSNGQRWQVMTHFLSMNPAENGTPRPTWQSSTDSSTIWGKAAASSTDPAYVAPGAIPWLLVQIVGAQMGPNNGMTGLTGITYIQRLNTAGGVAPATGCDATNYGKVALVPYETDYYFYQTARR